MKIEMGSKTYKTVCGLPVRVLCVDGPGVYPVLALVKYAPGEELQLYTAEGKLYPGYNGSANLVETSIWDDVPVDAKVFVRDYEYDDWQPMHFARYDKNIGVAYAYANSGTSHTTGAVWGYLYAKLA